MRKIILSNVLAANDFSVVVDTPDVLELEFESKSLVLAEKWVTWEESNRSWKEFCGKIPALMSKIKDVGGIHHIEIISSGNGGNWVSYYIDYFIVFDNGVKSDRKTFRLSNHASDPDVKIRRGYTDSNFYSEEFYKPQKRYTDTSSVIEILKGWLKERVKAYESSNYQNPYASRHLNGRRICSAAQQNQIPATLQVNRVGKYIYNHTEGAYKFVKSSNTYDVYITLLYQLLPQYVKRDSNGKRVTRQGEQMEWDYCPFCGDKLTNPNFGGCKECQDPMELNDVGEMTINVSIATYQNKIRVNTIEVDPMERTLGYDLFKPEEMVDLVSASKKIMEKVHGRIRRAYEKYDILF